MKKLIALLLALVMVLSLMACTAKEEPEKEEEKPADSEQKPAEDKKEETPAEDKKEDEKEEENEEAPADEAWLPLVKDGEATVTIGLQQHTNTENYDTNDLTLWIEEQTGVNLEFVYFSNDSTEANTQLNLMISGGQKLPDILWGMPYSATQMKEYGQEGYFLALNDYFEEYGKVWEEELAKMPQSDIDTMLAIATDSTDGSIYCYPTFSAERSDTMIAMPFINQTWLDKLGKEMPTNVDELYEVLKIFSEEDMNGNGEKDEIPMIGYTYAQGSIDMFIINAFVFCNDKYMFNVTDGQLWLPYVTEEYRDALRYLNKLYEENIFSPQFYSIQDTSELISIWTPASGVGAVGLVAGHSTLCMEQDNPATMEYVPLPILADETGLGGYGTLGGGVTRLGKTITCDAEDPVLAFKVLDFMNSEEASMRFRYGVPGRDWVVPEEGAVDAGGRPAKAKVLNGEAFTGQSNATWHKENGFCHDGQYVVEFNNDGGWKAHRSTMYWSCYKNFTDAGMPEEVVYDLVYTAEENEIVAEYKTILQDYVKEARALFVTGTYDIDSDADWENYLANLELQGMNEYLEISQTAYTRMNG